MNIDQLSKLSDIAERLEAETKRADNIIKSLKMTLGEYQDFLIAQIKLNREK